MAHYFRLNRPIAIAAGLAAALWMLPASASDRSDVGVGGVKEAAPAASTTTAPAKTGGETPRLTSKPSSDTVRVSIAEKPRYYARRYARRLSAASYYARRISAASYYQRRVRDVVSRECAGVWCGRPFVLLLGIGY